MTSDQGITLHGFKPSGHSHRAELMLRLLDLSYEFNTVDLRGGAQRTPTFLAMNPFGTVPVLEDGDIVVADSVAILVYLATRYDPARRWLPTDPVQAAKVQRWLSVAQGPVFNGPATARIIKLFGRPGDHQRAVAVAQELLKILESELLRHPFLVGEQATLADIAIYSYVARAPEGDVALDDFTAVRAWLARLEALPGFLAMPVAG
ncbi:MAG TPA: glutathione S-transferase [Stellaceae bacterium]|nr:glutathione S-transferase [Stellaceae bacterium]